MSVNISDMTTSGINLIPKSRYIKTNCKQTGKIRRMWDEPTC